MRRLLLSFILFTAFISNKTFAQTPGIVGTDAFFAGAWLEIGEQSNGDFGTSSSPTGYHVHPTGFGGDELAEVYDFGHDGWGVGSPAYMGDYTYPGSPFEGWEIQVGTARSQQFCNGGATGSFITTSGGVVTVTGSITGFSDIGGQQISTWSGTCTGSAGTIAITQQTEVDTFASWVTVTTHFINTGATTTQPIYYLRSCDPDNNESWGGSFTTENYIDYQNDADHRVQVHASTSDATPGGLPANNYPLGLNTKDCRAVAFIYDSWPVSSTTDLSTMWAETYTGAFYNVSPTSHTGDIAIGLVYKIGTLCPGDSTFISYAYTFNGATTALDSAFPEPAIVVNGAAPLSATPPNATYDTFNTCLHPGLNTLPVDLVNATTGVWTWSTWTWSPGIGLAATTGVTNTIDVYSLPPSITYTITGTGYSSVCGGGASITCGTKVFYLTVLTCNGATVNSPCIGAPLFFNAPGDSTGATYAWVGPNSWTSTVATTQSFTISPSVWADTGTYHVIKTVAGVPDTSVAIVVLHPKPTVTASSNSPLCIGAANTLSLTATPGAVPVATYAWGGPASFTSTLQDPTINPFTSSEVGVYSVVVTTPYGCMDTANTDVVLLPPPGAPTVTGVPAYCYGTPFVPFTVTATSGAVVHWYPTAAGTGTGTLTAPVVNTSSPGTYTFYYGQTIGLCESPIDSITVIVYPQIVPHYTYTIHRGCTEDTVYFTNTSTGGYTSDLWNFRDGTATSTLTNPEHIFASQGIYAVKLTDYLAICSDTFTMNINTKHSVVAEFSIPLGFDTICAGGANVVSDGSYATIGTGAGVITKYAWAYGNGTTSTAQNPGFDTFPDPGIYNISLTVTDNIGCTSTANQTVYVIGLGITSWHDTTLCLKQPLFLENTITQNPPLGLTDYTYRWTAPSGLEYLSSDTSQIPSFSNAFGSYTYTLTVSLAGDWIGPCKVKDTMIINSVLGRLLHDVTASATIDYGNSFQLNADSEVYYNWVPDNGTLSNPNINNPIATPDTTTTYTVYGMDQYGCVDSAFVTVTVDSTLHEFIPTGFTPNNDGLNDFFRPVGFTFQNLVEFRVYNRWGEQVFYTNNAATKGWDGTYNGVAQDMGTYFYTIIVGKPGGQNVVYKGDVTLIR